MARAFRFDRSELRPPQRRADGSVRYDATLSRAGVFPYRLPDGTIRREYRPPDEVGHKDSLASAELAHVVDDHPAKRGEAKSKSVGATGDAIRFDGKHVTGSLIVRDDVVNAKIAAGKHQLSPGYDVELDETPGITPEGERYDAVQRQIRYEHFAIVTAGRQGDAVALKTDGADDWRADAAVQVESHCSDVTVMVHSATLSVVDLDRGVRDALAAVEGVTVESPSKYDAVDAAIKPGTGWDQGYPPGRAAVRVSTRELGLNDLTAKLKAALASIDVVVGNPDLAATSGAVPVVTDRADSIGQEIHAMDEMKKKLDAALAEAAEQKARADAAEAKAKAETARADKAEGETLAQKARADKAETARADADSQAMPRALARLALEAEAKGVLGSEWKADGLDDTAIKAAVVAKLTGAPLDPAHATNPEFVGGAYAVAIKSAARADAAVDAAREVTGTGGMGREDTETEADAAKKMRERNAARSANTPPARS